MIKVEVELISDNNFYSFCGKGLKSEVSNILRDADKPTINI